ncbi:MAG: choice-of-anchor J domain-containing protein, partial [Candidatus Delongbacteria bacterium]|nr:choice-of-anchor J domain-containing protein [Candidatus Delongbacteria bacterium]
MKKLMTWLVVVFAAGLFAFNSLPADDVQAKPGAKGWVYYDGTPTYTYKVAAERAVYFDAWDFGLEYPVELQQIQWYVYATGVNYSYKVYAKDGSTLLYTSPDIVSAQGWQVTAIDPVILSDDFWIALVPQPDGTPTTIHDGGDGVFGHSFSGSAGSWTPLFGGGYNHSMAADIVHYTGADLYPPVARGVLGNNAFMDTDAVLTVNIIDQSAIVEPVVGEYSFDGTNWTSFNLSAAKAVSVYTGTIPAQADGTTGTVRFNMEDALGYTSVSDEFTITWSVDNPILSEGFESVFPPVGWSTNYVGAGFIQVDDSDPVIDQVHSGNYSAAHLDDQGTQDDWLITPLVSIPATNSSTLTFWQNGYWLNYVVDGYHEVAVSTDMTTWDVIYTGHPPVGNVVGNVWEKLYLSLSAYLGQDIYIGFRYVGDWEDQWFIDDVAVMYDYEGPTVVDLVGNEALYPTVGAYLNNDMNLSLTVNDLTGAASVVGHYSFDDWTTTTDLSFAMSKGGDEIWTATIPAESAVMSGLIYFDMTDLGGNSSASDTLAVEFVLDADAPVMALVKGTSAYVNSPMNLEITFLDESAITSCSGYYSPTGLSFSGFEMTPSKAHTYVYTGTIAASSVEIFDGKVYFAITDAEGNTLTTDQYQVQWLDGQTEFMEDFESGLGNWTLDGNWGLEEGTYTSAINALTESPYDDYLEDEVTFAQWATPFDLTSFPSAKITFWTKFDLEDDFDYMYFEGSKDGGTTWIRINTFNGEGIDWHEEKVSMDAFCGFNNVTFRFAFESDGGYQTEGMYIDDLSLVTYNVDHAAPSILAEDYAPLFYEGVLGDYTVQSEIVDFSGVAATAVAYTVDGGAEVVVMGTNTTGDMYEFVIPTQPAGSLVSYTVRAQDGSPDANVGESPAYSYVAGDHMIYDDGYVSFLDEALDNNAWAVKFTVPGSDTETLMTGKLSYLLLRNYHDPSHVSATMRVHVWADEAGLPGTELISLDAESEAPSFANAMTRVDLRSYDQSVTGDFWVGVSSPYGSVYITYTNMTDHPESTPYERSYNGSWNGVDAWTWTQSPLDNFHFRAVLDGAYVGIDENENIPMVTELAQNYPNPFNPATTINFNLAKDAKVSLVVYDVMGRKVA